MEAKRSARNPEFQAKISQMARTLSPLVRLTTGEVNRFFPSTLLNFWLLTSEQCDELYVLEENPFLVLDRFITLSRDNVSTLPKLYLSSDC